MLSWDKFLFLTNLQLARFPSSIVQDCKLRLLAITIRRSEHLDLIPLPPWGYCEIPGDLGVRIRKEVGVRLPRVPFVAIGRAAGSHTPVLGRVESASPLVFCLPISTCTKLEFSEGFPRHNPSTIELWLYY